MSNQPRESDLYAPVKCMLEAQGYDVKGEVAAADIVAVRGDDEPIVVELKTGFALSLFHQAVDRQKLTDAVYIAVPQGKGRKFLTAVRKNLALCRRLGLGLLIVNLADQTVSVKLDPKAYAPRIIKRRRSRLLNEFSKLVGDPNVGGSTRRSIITAYRQDALRCLSHLHAVGSDKAANVARCSNVPRARRLMADNHYGWFERVQTGIYSLSPKGHDAVKEYEPNIRTLAIASHEQRSAEQTDDAKRVSALTDT